MHFKTKIVIGISCGIVASLIVAVGVFSNLKNTPKEITTSYLRATYTIDYSDMNAVVGDADYVFIGTVVSNDGTVYKDTIISGESKKEYSNPYTNYTVNVTENIKGNLITSKSIPIQKSGGLSKDGSEYIIYEGDELPIVGNSYIFFAYAQPDGTLLISGPVSNMNLNSNPRGRSVSSEQSNEYAEVVEACNNQIDSGRERFKASYEVK